MHKVTKIIDFCYGHRLLNHRGKCRHLHGHNGILEVDIESDALDDLGMVMDFSDLREVIKSWIDANLDHRMILCKQDPIVPMLKEVGEPMFLMDENPTAENISKLIYQQSKIKGVDVSEIRLWETPSSYATYRGD